MERLSQGHTSRSRLDFCRNGKLSWGHLENRLRVDNRGFTISSEKTALVVATRKSEHSSKLKYLSGSDPEWARFWIAK